MIKFSISIQIIGRYTVIFKPSWDLVTWNSGIGILSVRIQLLGIPSIGIESIRIRLVGQFPFQLLAGIQSCLCLVGI